MGIDDFDEAGIEVNQIEGRGGDDFPGAVDEELAVLELVAVGLAVF